MFHCIVSLFADNKYGFLVGHEYSVGRKDCDILVESDMSISRKHATLKVTHEEANLVGTVTVHDFYIVNKTYLSADTVER